MTIQELINNESEIRSVTMTGAIMNIHSPQVGPVNFPRLSKTAKYKDNIVNAIVYAEESASPEVKITARTALLKLSLSDLKAIWAVLSLKAVQS